MNVIPTYDKKKSIHLRPGDVDTSYDIREFETFLNKLIEEDLLEDDAELGILKFVLDNGTERLSSKQLFRLEEVIKRTSKKCSRCEEEFTWTELNAMEGDLCASCQHDWDSMKD